jgi:N4-(beta-N-acetylglucosaminyl)-L-asparaginase
LKVELSGWIVFLSSPNANLGLRGDVMSELPDRPDLDQLRRQARELVRAATESEPHALARLRVVSERVTLSAAQLAVAREYGFPSWPALRTEAEHRRRMSEPAAKPPYRGDHGRAYAAEDRWSLGGASAIKTAAGVLSPGALVIGPDHAGLRDNDWELRMRRMEEIAAEIGIPPELRMDAIRSVTFPPTGTIHCSVRNEKAEMSGCTTTSGLAWKIPGRVGDSPIIGAGCYTDQEVGSAGATGSGEENIKVAGAHTIVENMRHGMSPLDAGMDALNRLVRNYNGDRERLQFIDMSYYVLRKDGAYAGVSLWEGYEAGKPHKIAVHDGVRRAEKTVSLFAGVSQEWPPTPK